MNNSKWTPLKQVTPDSVQLGDLLRIESADTNDNAVIRQFVVESIEAFSNPHKR